MGSYMNFKGFSQAPTPGDGGKQLGNFPLGRQSSIYSLTFDELQTTFSGIGKDFGSMNMDELLKNLWSVDEAQNFSSAVPVGNLQRQCSLTLPRTLSHKTVDKIWKDMFQESNGVNDSSAGTRQITAANAVPTLQQRQQTLGEITLEEFLVRAGIVKEEAQIQPMVSPSETGFYVSPSETGFYGELFQSNNNMGLDVSFQQPTCNTGIMSNRIAQNNIPDYTQATSLAVDIDGLKSFQQLPQPQQQQQQQQLQNKLLFSKPTNASFASPMNLAQNSQLGSPAQWSPIVAAPSPCKKICVRQSNGIQNRDMAMATQLSPDLIGKNDIKLSSFSPASYGFTQGTRGRKRSGGFEKVVERRHRRMIKNRESAAKSRARKQAYTSDLEAEIVVLKERNEELQKKQVEITEMQNNQIIERMKLPWGGKRVCLRRTITGPW